MSETELMRVLKFLRDRADTIRDLEAQAKQELETRGDKDVYDRLLQQKAQLISYLPEELPQEAHSLPPGQKNLVLSELDSMRSRAQQALQLQSPFFMALLLYPQDYREGEDNELESLLRQLEG